MNTEKSKLSNPTMIQKLGQLNENCLYIKRDDLLPFSFGGNKARKAVYFFDDIRSHNANCVVTYGSNSSNHCRIIANMAASMKLKCVIIVPLTDEEKTFNLKMVNFFNAEIVYTQLSCVAETISTVMADLAKKGYNPYFIMGGGHGNLGTKAYVDCFSEISDYEADNDVHFDYIFHASGTGTTQAGLICGKILQQKTNEIIGISIARKNPYGANVVRESIAEYLDSVGINEDCTEHLKFIDDYILDGYGKYNNEVDDTIKDVLINYGIPLNRTYTGKAFWGMSEYLKSMNIKNKNVLFIHTGGTPLFFDYLKGIQA